MEKSAERAHFADYDHENERHVEICVRDGAVEISRHIDFNSDYAPDEDPPEDWSEYEELEFDTDERLASFLAAFGEELVNRCFGYFHDGEQLDSDEALEAWNEFVTRIGDPEEDVDHEKVDSLSEFPR